MIQIRPSAYILAAMLVLTVPPDWLCAFLFSSAIHEAGHLAAIILSGGRAEAVTIGFCGAQIFADIPGKRREFLCAGAGPAASMLLLLFRRIFPKLAICGAIQGIFNLLPVHPMDGGRMLRCLLQWMLPQRADRICRFTEYLVLCIIALLSLMASLRFRDGLFPVLCCVTAFSRLLFGKIPCKSGKLAVQ